MRKIRIAKRTPFNWLVRMTVGAPKKIAAQVTVERSVELLNLLLSRGADPSIGDKKIKRL